MLQQIMHDIIGTFKLPPVSYEGGGRIIAKEIETWLAINPMTMKQADYLLNTLASDIHRETSQIPVNTNARCKFYKDHKGMAEFIKHGMTDAVAAKRANPIRDMLDMDMPPQELKLDIQELNTLLQDVVHNTETIFGNGDDLDSGSFPLLSSAIKAFKKTILPDLETAMADHGIALERHHPEKGCEFFYRVNAQKWMDLGANAPKSTATSRPRGLEC